MPAGARLAVAGDRSGQAGHKVATWQQRDPMPQAPLAVRGLDCEVQRFLGGILLPKEALRLQATYPPR